jgi:tRNA threonylcarbamoyladenosine biosynthesis protein TsaB
MVLLGIDTSGKQGSIALARIEPPESPHVLGVVDLVGGTFSAQLVPQIAALLAQHEVAKEEIGGFIVVSGPGSFTGLRVGLAAIKALAEILAKPIVPISLLQIIGSLAGLTGMVAIDAGRNEAYVGAFDGATGQIGEERLVSLNELTQISPGLTVITCDANLASQARGNGREVKEILRPRADAVIRAGWRRIKSGQVVTPEALEANYIRRSDAEIFFSTQSKA